VISAIREGEGGKKRGLVSIQRAIRYVGRERAGVRDR